MSPYSGRYKTKLGNLGEKLAEKYLSKKGFKIIERKFSCFLGEIDLIARKKDLVVFIEVKTRRSSNYDPLESITYKKRKKISQIAKYYSQKLKEPTGIRFDVIGITISDNEPKIEHVENAFFVI